MALPPPTAMCWRRLANGGLAQIRTDNLGTKMLTKRIQLSSAPVSEKIAEIHLYFSKWERGLADEIAQFV